jgi:hypothetical protein
MHDALALVGVLIIPLLIGSPLDMAPGRLFLVVVARPHVSAT